MSTTGESSDIRRILEQERRNARSAGITESPKPMRRLDALNNPFANLPIPEAALPRSPSPSVGTAYSGAAQPQPTVMPGPMPTPLTAQQPQQPGMPQQPGISQPSNGPVLGSTSAPAVGSGFSPAVSGAPSSNFAAAQPQTSVAQPYEFLRRQEAERRQQQWNNNRPTVQDLRTNIPDPSKARLF
jgi:hypothetical protein